MRVLVLNWRDIKNPTAGGAEVVVDNLLRGLASLGHKVTLFTSGYKNCKKFERTTYAQIIRKGSTSTVYLHAFLYYQKHRNDFDFIIESVSAVPFFTPLYFDSRRIIIIPHHIVGSVTFKEIPFPQSLLAYSAERLIPLVYRGVSFVAVSSAVKSELVRFGVSPRAVTTCYFNAYSQFKAKKLKKFSKPTLVTVSRLMRYKRLDLLLGIFKQLLEKKDANFIIAGTGKESANLRSRTKRLGLENKVRFTGWIGENEKAELLSRSWVFVTASEREGFGMSALEAEMSGTPVVAFNIGGLSESVKNNFSGFLIREGDTGEFVNRLAELLSDAKLRERLSRNSISYASRFDRKSATRSIDRIMRKNMMRN